MENNNLLKIFRQKFLRNAKHAISARGSSVDQQNALAPIRRVGSCKEGVKNLCVASSSDNCYQCYYSYTCPLQVEMYSKLFS